MINQEITILNCSPGDVYKALTDSNLHSKITGDVANIDARVGGEYSAFSGYAKGKYLNLIKNKLIEHTWRASNWPDGHYSTVKFEFSKSGTATKINFTQENLPEGTIPEFESGWQDNYWSPMQDYFKA